MKKFRRLQGQLTLHFRVESCCEIILDGKKNYKKIYGEDEYNKRREEFLRLYEKYERAPSTQLGQSMNLTAAHLLHCLTLDQIERLKHKSVQMNADFLPEDIPRPATENDSDNDDQDSSSNSSAPSADNSNDLFDHSENSVDNNEDIDRLVLSKNKKSFEERECDLKLEEVEFGKAVKTGN